jgi:hypothetical protein
MKKSMNNHGVGKNDHGEDERERDRQTDRRTDREKLAC